MSENSKVSMEFRDGIAIITLSPEPKQLPVLNRERMSSLEASLLELEGSKELKGLLIVGSRDSGFCAGADVNAIRDVVDSKVGAKLAAEGQALFQRIEDLGVPSVALIHGPCVGGGYEMALSCTYRVALNVPETRIGLPEIKLGILPGFGGTQRLPRLIGLPKALEIILNGKVISAIRAKKSGMIDLLLESGTQGRQADVEALVDIGLKLVSGEEKVSRPQLKISEKILTFSSIGRFVAKYFARKGIIKETKGLYPAPLRALEVAISGLAKAGAQAYQREAKALGELIVTPESKSLVHIYFCTETSTKLGRSLRKDVAGASVGVLGAGVMGSGIAATFLYKGHSVVLLDPNEEARVRARKSIEKFLVSRRGLSEERRWELLDSLTVTDKMSEMSECSLVVEAIIENLEIKKDTFRSLSEVVSGECILASNTSSLSVSELAKDITGPQRIVGMHFFNPAEKMPLVEVVRAEQTSERTLLSVAAFASCLGKYPVVVEDVPGFLVNRILSPYIAEAGRLLSEGVSIDTIDSVATSFGMPMGPFRMLDEVGLDVAAKVQEEMTKAYGERMHAPEYPKLMVEAKRFGKKSKEGFYSFENGQAKLDPSVYEILGVPVAESKHISSETIKRRLVLALVQEAVRCLDEGVAGAVSEDASGQLDLATVMGMGFAPFRGGVLYYAESLGVSKVVEQLKELEQEYGARFAPVDGLLIRKKNDLGLFVEVAPGQAC